MIENECDNNRENGEVENEGVYRRGNENIAEEGIWIEERIKYEYSDSDDDEILQRVHNVILYYQMMIMRLKFTIL